MRHKSSGKGNEEVRRQEAVPEEVEEERQKRCDGVSGWWRLLGGGLCRLRIVKGAVWGSLTPRIGHGSACAWFRTGDPSGRADCVRICTCGQGLEKEVEPRQTDGVGACGWSVASDVCRG